MKCPNCQAKLLPVDGVMFCLQCGRAVAMPKSGGESAPAVDETDDPLLQKAITDSLGHPVKWKLPVAGARPKEVKSFGSLHMALAATRPLVPVAAGSGGAAVSLPSAPTRQTERQDPAVPEAKQGVAALNLLPVKVAKSWARKGEVKLPSLGWVIGLAAFAVFVLGNLAIYGLYSNRVYPGVRVDGVSVGGMTESELTKVLNDKATASGSTNVVIGGAKYPVVNSTLATPDLGRASREAMGVGHNVYLPVAGLISALFSKPVTIQQTVDDGAAQAAVQRLANEVDHAASEPAPMIVGAQAFVIGEKSGEEISIDMAVTSLEAAVAAGKSEVSIPSVVRAPLQKAGDFQNDISAAQARIGLNLQIRVGSAAFTPTPQQIGGWLIFGGAGKGVSVDQGAVAGYVTSLPGAFDRSGTFGALVSAVSSGVNLTYAASSSKVTVTPKVDGTGATMPLATYSYCVAASGSTSELSTAIAGTLGDPNGWGLGGRIKYLPVATGCNFTISLVNAAAMGQLDQRCAKASTCRVGNQIELNKADWLKPPADWKSGSANYQTGMINQEVGHWLGFDHSSCTTKSQPTSVLQAPTLVLDGCSPNWYLESSDQSAKVLPGF